MPKVISYSAERETRNSKVDYNANGEMLIDLVNRKYTLTVYLGELTQEEMQLVLSQTDDVFFQVSFYTPQRGSLQRKFHLAKEPCEVDYQRADGKPVYKATKLVLEEM